MIFVRTWSTSRHPRRPADRDKQDTLRHGSARLSSLDHLHNRSCATRRLHSRSMPADFTTCCTRVPEVNAAHRQTAPPSNIPSPFLSPHLVQLRLELVVFEYGIRQLNLLRARFLASPTPVHIRSEVRTLLFARCKNPLCIVRS